MMKNILVSTFMVLLFIGVFMGGIEGLVNMAFASFEQPQIEETVQEVECDLVIEICEPEPEEEEEVSPLDTAIPLGEVRATAYCACEKCCGKWAEYGLTASGVPPVEGITIAVDTDVIPMHSQVYMEMPDGEIHCFTAQDTGSAIKGNRVDVFFESHQDALEWGVKMCNAWYTAA